MTYEMLKINDHQMLEVLSLARKYGAMTMVHAENDDIINWLSERLLTRGNVAPKFHAVSHNSIAESEASSQGLGGDDLQGEGAQKTYPREVKLGGILYNGVEDWIIWINQTRITPGAIPSEILDISVYDNYVELKWFDGETNKIYPIRLRPNQRFNIDARMFLPG